MTWVHRLMGPGMLSLLGGLGLSQTRLCPLGLGPGPSLPLPQPCTLSCPCSSCYHLLCPGNPNPDLTAEDNSAPCPALSLAALSCCPQSRARFLNHIWRPKTGVTQAIDRKFKKPRQSSKVS